MLSLQEMFASLPENQLREIPSFSPVFKAGHEPKQRIVKAEQYEKILALLLQAQKHLTSKPASALPILKTAMELDSKGRVFGAVYARLEKLLLLDPGCGEGMFKAMGAFPNVRSAALFGGIEYCTSHWTALIRDDLHRACDK
jgi:hypothetical protein